MAYTPTEWKNGDIVTAEKLNKAEQGIANATGYSIETTETVLVPQQSATTADPEELGEYGADLTGDIVMPANGDTCKVTFNGTDYTCTATQVEENVFLIGDDSFTEYPFLVVFIAVYEEGNEARLLTETAGTYTVKVTKPTQSIELTDGFKAAIDAIPLYDIELIFDDPDIIYAKGDYMAFVGRCADENGALKRPPRMNIWSPNTQYQYAFVDFTNAVLDGEIAEDGYTRVIVQDDNGYETTLTWHANGTIELGGAD